jgi:hypothetical protein
MASRQDLAVIINAINSIRVELGKLSNRLTSVEGRLSTIEAAGPIPREQYFLPEDGGVPLPVLQATETHPAESKPQRERLSRATTADEAFDPAQNRDCTCHGKSDSCVTSSDLRGQLQPINDRIAALTKLVSSMDSGINIEKIINVDKAYSMKLDTASRRLTSDHASQTEEVGQKDVTSQTDQVSQRDASIQVDGKPIQEENSFQFDDTPARRSGIPTFSASSTLVSHTSSARAAVPGTACRSFKEFKARSMSSKSPKKPRVSFPAYTRNVFGQASTPNGPRRVSLNLLGSPFGTYAGEKSPFTQLAKTDGGKGVGPFSFS